VINQPAAFPWTWPWVSGGCREDGLWKSLARNRPGKTTVALHVIAEAQKRVACYCAFVDAGTPSIPTYAANLGANIDELLVSQPDTGEQALGDRRGAGA